MKGVRVIYFQPTYIKSISMSLNDPEIFWDVKKKKPEMSSSLKTPCLQGIPEILFFS